MSIIRMLLPYVPGAKPILPPWAEGCVTLQREAEKLDAKLHVIGESRRVIDSLLHAIDAGEKKLLDDRTRRGVES